MNIAIDNYEEMMLKTILDRVKEEFSEDEDIKVWMDLSAMNLKNVIFLKKLLKSIKENESYSNSAEDIKYTAKEKTLKVGTNEEKQYEKDVIEKMLSIIISALESILPLGSVVKLNKKYIENLVITINEKNESERVNKKVTKEDFEMMEIMIDKRFLKTNIEDKYIEYGGNVFPMSSIDKTAQFLFTNDDVSEILYKGYINEVEKRYVCLIKEELIVNQKKTSIVTL